MYKLKRLNNKNIEQAISFILPFEYSCVNLSYKLLTFRQMIQNHQNAEAEHFLRGFLLINKANSQIEGIIAISNATFLYCFPKTPTEKFFLFLCELFPHEIQNTIKRNFTLLGTSNVTKKLETYFFKYFELEPYRTQDYALLYLQKKNALQSIELSQPCTLNLKFSTCTPNDLDELLPLQIDYENTEVLAGYGVANPKITKLHLNKLLNTQLIYKAELDGKIIAKAGTNARGVNFDQIGGVYTLPRYRKLGVSHALMQYIIADRLKSNTLLTLYVKNENAPANRLYAKLRFTKQTDFRISYF